MIGQPMVTERVETEGAETGPNARVRTACRSIVAATEIETWKETGAEMS